MFDWLTSDPYAEARAFYGPAFEWIRQWEQKRRECNNIAAQVIPTFVDDVAHQAPHLDDRWPTVAALMR